MERKSKKKIEDTLSQVNYTDTTTELLQELVKNSNEIKAILSRLKERFI